MGPARRANNYSFVEVCRKSKVSTMEYILFRKLLSLSSHEGGSKDTLDPPPCICCYIERSSQISHFLISSILSLFSLTFFSIRFFLVDIFLGENVYFNLCRELEAEISENGEDKTLIPRLEEAKRLTKEKQTSDSNSYEH